MDHDRLKEEPEAEDNNILIRHQKKLILPRGLIHLLVEPIRHQADLIHLLRGAVAVREGQQVEGAVQEVGVGNKMKKYFLPSAFIILIITLTGCYTVAWNPGDNNFPTKDNTLKSGDSLYAQTGYDFYDNSPWWWNIDPTIFDNNENTDIGDQDLISPTITIINYGPSIPFVPPPVGTPIVRPPVHTPTPVKPEDNNKNNSQNVRPRDNINNSSTNTRNDNGSRNTDTGRKR